MSRGRIERGAAALRLAEQSHSPIIPSKFFRLPVDLRMDEFPRFGQVVLIDIFFDLRPPAGAAMIGKIVVPGGFDGRFSRVAAYFPFGRVEEDQAAALTEVAHRFEAGLPARRALLRVAGEAVQ